MLMPTLVLAQNTTSNLSGTAKTASGDPLIGATITATHVPTGTVYRVQSRTAGRFDITNMNPGGPYTIEASFVNYENLKREDVYLNLGETFRLELNMTSKSANLGNVAVTSAAKTRDLSSKGGTGTSIGADKMDNLPTVGRNISDFVRFVPQAKITGDGGIALAGQNNRYNAFYIDGAVNNDVFGLAASGTNGGQSGAPPISVDAIDQFQVVLSPYDASLGNFTGGGINAITRSGTNQTKASLYYYFRNEDMAGKTPGNVAPASRVKLSDFQNKTFGFRIGGALVKNKLFYFASYENQDDVRPQPFDINQYQGAMKQVDIDKFRNDVLTKFGYDPGSYIDNPDQLKATRFTAKIDWNMSEKHKVSISHRYNNAERYNTSRSSVSTINFFNNGYIFPSKTNSTSFELKSNASSKVSNKLLVTYTSVVDDRGALNKAFPRVTINTNLSGGSGSRDILILGTENFSTANLLKQNNLSIFDAVKINAGKNLITIGTDNEFNYAYNVFIRNNYGSYTFNSVSDFLNGGKAVGYERSYSLLDKTTGDNTNAAAEFRTRRLGFFFNDEIRVNDKFTLNLGIRADNTKFLTTPVTDTFFNKYAIPQISKYHDLRGAQSGTVNSPKWEISPRVGFTYKINEEDLIIRGGVGYFTGRVPLVWPGGTYNNTGVGIGETPSNIRATNLNITFPGGAPLVFNPDINTQYTAESFGASSKTPSGEINLIASNFRMPKLMRASLAFDKKLKNGWTSTLEFMVSKNINEIDYASVKNLPATLMSAGAGSREVYNATGGPIAIPMSSPAVTSNPYSNIFILGNNKGPKGFAYNATITLDKAWSKGFAFNMNYTIGNSIVLNEGTSSQNSSQWRFMESVNGRNNITLSHSDFDLGHRINAYIAKKVTYGKNKNLGTTFSLVYNGQSGSPFSYVNQNSMVRDYGTGESNDLIYVPRSSSEIVFLTNTTGGVTYTAAQQWALFNDYIENDKYLSKRRGQFAERNGARTPFSHIIDLKIQQDFNIKINGKRHQIQISYDVFNLTNLLNREWGRQYFVTNDNFRLLNFAGFVSSTNLTPQFRFTPLPGDGKPYTLSDGTFPGNSSRWTSQLGIRYNFN